MLLPHTSRTCTTWSLFLDPLSQHCPCSLSSSRIAFHDFYVGSSLCLDRTNGHTFPTLCLSCRTLGERELHSGDSVPCVRCCVVSEPTSLSLSGSFLVELTDSFGGHRLVTAVGRQTGDRSPEVTTSEAASSVSLLSPPPPVPPHPLLPFLPPPLHSILVLVLELRVNCDVGQVRCYHATPQASKC